MGLFKGLKNLFIAKSNEAEQKIEDANIVSFSEEDIHIVGPESWPWTGIEHRSPTARRWPRWSGLDR